MKINAKTFRAFKYAHRAGITSNDNYNVAEFGISHAQYSAILRCVEDIDGLGGTHTVTLRDLNEFIGGRKVRGACMHPDLERRLLSSFVDRANEE